MVRSVRLKRLAARYSFGFKPRHSAKQPTSQGCGVPRRGQRGLHPVLKRAVAEVQLEAQVPEGNMGRNGRAHGGGAALIRDTAQCTGPKLNGKATDLPPEAESHHHHQHPYPNPLAETVSMHTCVLCFTLSARCHSNLPPIFQFSRFS